MPMQEYLIGRITAVPSFMRAILPALETAYVRRIQSSLKVLVLSGETFHLSLWKILVKILPQTTILNLYGSTEVRPITYGIFIVRSSLPVVILVHD